MYTEELKKLIQNEFTEETLDELTEIPNALTTIAYKVIFKSGKKLIVKIGFDEKDIAGGKGHKEMSAIKLANELIGPKSPKLVKYIDSYTGFPGYITFLEFVDGEVLSAEVFNDVARSEENLKEMVDILINLHSYTQDEFSDLKPNRKKSFEDYFLAEDKDIKSSLITADLFEKLESQYKKLTPIYDYFKDYSDFHFLHGDVNFKNVLMKDNKIKALIDWDRSMIGPIAFEFAHVSTLTAVYGVTKWHTSLVKSYLDKYQGDSEKLNKEFKMIEFFIYFKLLMRKVTHRHQMNAVEISIETGEELKDHFVRKILEFDF